MRNAAVLAIACIGFWITISAAAYGLSNDRAYEMVTPVYKGGYGATHIEGVGPYGNSVAYYSPGVFEGAPAGVSSSVNTVVYVACRGVHGWSTESIVPPDSLVPMVFPTADLSPTMDSTVVLGKPNSSREAAVQLGKREEVLLHLLAPSTCVPDTADSWERIGPPLEAMNGEPVTFGYSGASADFCHLLLQDASFGEGGVVGVPLSEGTQNQQYEIIRGCNGESAGIKMIALNNKGEPITSRCQVSIGGFGGTNDSSSYNAVAGEGRVLFFESCVENQDELHTQLFARLNAQRTIEISKPIESCTEVPCSGSITRANGKFQGASEDGSLVYLLSESPLAGETGDTSDNLYLAKLGCEPSETTCEVAKWTVTKLVKVSRAPAPGGEGRVRGVVRIATNGERAYFVADGDLLGGAGETALRNEGKPVPRVGAANLYVYEISGGVEKISFIADLCTGGERSGSVQDTNCPVASGATDSFLWRNEQKTEAQTAGPGGRYLVFVSYARLTPDDTDNARDVFRYDAVTHTITRVSLGEGGYHANGNGENTSGVESVDAKITGGNVGNHYLRFQYEMNSRAISEDGSRVVFTSAEPLSPSAINGLPNAYEWYNGEVSLVSTGASETPVEDVVITSEGNDIFFDTTEGILPQDTDGAPDIYDARIGGGFPEPPAPRQQCSSDACQGALTNPAPLLIPGSAVQEAGQNFSPPSPPPPAKKPAVKRKTRHTVCKRIHGHRKCKVVVSSARHG